MGTEVCDVLEQADVAVTCGEGVADGFYTVDVVATLKKPPSDQNHCRVGILLDVGSGAFEDAPRDPWIQLKHRHLSSLGWSVAWLPTKRWHSWDEEARQEFVSDVLARLQKA